MTQEINEEFLRFCHEKYLRQRERIDLPRMQIGDRQGERRFRASRLHGCSVADHYARTNMPHTHPHPYSLLQRFEQGNRVAEVWQEALVWTSRQSGYEWMTVQVEHPMENDVLVGQADIVVNGIPVEIKNTNRFGFQGGHILQLMAYCHMLNAPHGYLIYQSEFKNVVARVPANEEVLMNAVAAMAHPETAPQHIWEIKPGQCSVETDPESIFPREAKRANPRTGAKKGDIVPGRGTVKCPWFGHCFPWSDKRYGFLTFSTREEYDAGHIGAAASADGEYEQGSD